MILFWVLPYVYSSCYLFRIPYLICKKKRGAHLDEQTQEEKEKEKEEAQESRYNFINYFKYRPHFEQLKRRHVFTNLHHAIYFGKRFLMGIFIAVTQLGNHWARTIVLFVIQAIFFILILIVRPYKERVLNILYALNEGFCLIMTLFFIFTFE
jgi:hypothetical protein